MIPLTLVLVLGMFTVPGSAAAVPDAELPEACEGRTRDIRVAEDEAIVQRTYYWVSASPLGNVDAWTNPGALRLVEDEPPDGRSSAYVSNAGGIGNWHVARNPHLGYFVLDVADPGGPRLVCYSAEFWAATNHRVWLGLWTGQMGGVLTGTTSTGEGLADGIRHFTASNPDVELGAERYGVPTHLGDSVVVQLYPQPECLPASCPPVPNSSMSAEVLYGSTVHPSSVTLVTVEKIG